MLFDAVFSSLFAIFAFMKGFVHPYARKWFKWTGIQTAKIRTEDMAAW